MTKQRVVLCDDDGLRVQTWKSSIERVPALTDIVEVQALEPKEFADVYAALEARQLAARRGQQVDFTDRASVLDQADIVIVDFDLTPREQKELGDDSLRQLVGSFGDVFAYLTRCYTSAGFTVLVNQTFFQSTFDLTMSEFSHSYADLNITDSDLGRETLWFGRSSPDEFRPWHWPRLIDAAALLRSIENRLELESNVFESLGLDGSNGVGLFDAKQLEPLGIVGETAAIEALTFKELASERCQFGRRSRSEVLSDAQEKRLAAAAMSHWLERIVLPAQNVFVDAPHLAERRPHLVREGGWDALTDLSIPNFDSFLEVDQLEDAKTPADDWMSRPTWLWAACPPPSFEPTVEENRVFCEDVSAFVSPDEAIEFRSSVAGPWTQRYVSKSLVDAERSPLAEEPQVDYRPETRFY